MLHQLADISVEHSRSRCDTWLMPTSRPRHVIPETADVARALDDAARRWPEGSHDPRRLLLLLIAEGHHAIVEEHRASVAAERREAALRTGGALTGIYGDGYLTELHQDWPE
jgi:hypothetical protein